MTVALFLFKKLGQTWPLFIFSSFSHTVNVSISTIWIEKSIDGVFGIRTHGCKMEGTDETMELWRTPIPLLLYLEFNYLNETPDGGLKMCDWLLHAFAIFRGSHFRQMDHHGVEEWEVREAVRNEECRPVALHEAGCRCCVALWFGLEWKEMLWNEINPNT